MPKSTNSAPESISAGYAAQIPDALLNAFQINDRINQYLIENLPPDVWNAKLPDGKGRTIAAIVAHIHNVRVMWLKAAKLEEIPEQLEPKTLTLTEAQPGLKISGSALSALIRRALEGDGRIKNFRPDVAGFVGYLIAHDAHHRGQITMLARQLGHALPQKAMFGMWEWGKR